MIRLSNICKSFNDQVVLDQLNLTVEPEKITVIIGQSGCGKSVLLKHMIALIRPDSGQVIVDGEDITSLDEKGLNQTRKKFGMLFQDAALFDSMTVGDNVAFPLREHTRLSEKDIEEVVFEKLKLVGLTESFHKMPSELSGGMRKRVGLARAIALDPKIILFDEPTTGLDPIMKDAIDGLIMKTQELTQATCVVISHDIDSAFKIANKLAMLSDGRIVESGTPEEFQASKNPVVVNFIKGHAETNNQN
ncbi:MAG TPA: ABC transporter ATP-binding protein [Deltaproteobacteria bacterium]|nr:ABC transporter ATP-binding protein [Deltaproteobacteria bacterium]